MSALWILSEESPFHDDDESGGCVCGVFDTAPAALLYLAGYVLEEEHFAVIVWTAWAPDAYEGRGHGAAIYILRRHAVQTEARLRADLAALEAHVTVPPLPLLVLTTAELLAMLTAPEHDQHKRQMLAFLQRQVSKET